MLVTAIMPTRGRPRWAAHALHCFRAQTHPDKELIVLDDDDDPSFPHGLPDTLAAYYRLDHRLRISAKRNRCAELGRGVIIMHFDSDDWSAPERMADQVERLEHSGKAVTAYHSMLFYDESSSQAYKYTGHPSYGIGTSLAYRRDWWKAHPFDEALIVEEDNKVVHAATLERQLISVDAGSLMVARIHRENASSKHVAAAEYRGVPREILPSGFFP